ncbi:hypothetical protein [Smaragdicoccus niigatensis]|uniref:hypothetical protein n=1 Tax=Smaragdicoccus niigatensis TaxID=359359 RepID=UPI00037F24B1|nr:hypothetical protein [Smaragdicoccus niigatensis]
MTASIHVATAVVFVWIGLVVGISCIEAPLKFRAPGVTIPIGLGIGRLVFRAINSVETVLALILIIALVVGSPGAPAIIALGIAIASLAAQILAVRPRLTRRTNAVLAGSDAPRSRAHHAYVALEVVKLGALIVGGVAVMS